MTDDRDGHSSIAAGVLSALVRRFGVDPRALAALRVSLGTILLLDVGLRARDLTTFYTDAGVLPVETLARQFPAYSSVSLHAASGATWLQGLLFLLAAAVAVALLVGYRTRVATLGSLVLLVSLHARNPMVLNAGDVLLRRLLFWGLFLPLGARWAADAHSGEGPREWIAGLASAGLLVQVVLVYATNVAFKLRTDAWLSGEAIRYVFGLEQFTVGLGPVVARYPALLELGALGWFALLCLSPLLVVLTGRLRAVLVSLFAAGHVGMLVTMDLGIFPLVSLAALLPFLPTAVWDRVETVTVPLRSAFAGWLPSNSPSASSVSFGRWARALLSTFLAVLLVTMLLLNAVAVGVSDPPSAVPEAVEDRSWNMFGNPPTSEGWYVATGTFESGREATGRVARDRWRSASEETGGRYPNARWRKYQIKLATSDDERLHAHLAAEVCRRWSARGDDPLHKFTLVHVVEETDLTGADHRTADGRMQFDCSIDDRVAG